MCFEGWLTELAYWRLTWLQLCVQQKIILYIHTLCLSQWYCLLNVKLCYSIGAFFASLLCIFYGCCLQHSLQVIAFRLVWIRSDFFRNEWMYDVMQTECCDLRWSFCASIFKEFLNLITGVTLFNMFLKLDLKKNCYPQCKCTNSKTVMTKAKLLYKTHYGLNILMWNTNVQEYFSETHNL